MEQEYEPSQEVLDVPEIRTHGAWILALMSRARPGTTALVRLTKSVTVGFASNPVIIWGGAKPQPTITIVSGPHVGSLHNPHLNTTDPYVYYHVVTSGGTEGIMHAFDLQYLKL